jgi:hypothetical protein
MSRRIRLTNAEWDALASAVAEREARLRDAQAAGGDADEGTNDLAALARALDKIADLMRPIRKPR